MKLVKKAGKTKLIINKNEWKKIANNFYEEPNEPNDYHSDYDPNYDSPADDMEPQYDSDDPNLQAARASCPWGFMVIEERGGIYAVPEKYNSNWWTYKHYIWNEESKQWEKSE